MAQLASNFDLRLDTRSRSVVRELSYGEGSLYRAVGPMLLVASFVRNSRVN